MELLVACLRAVFGMGALVFLCWLVSENRKAINWKLALSGIGLQIALALLVLKVPWTHVAVEAVSRFFYSLVKFSDQGAAVIFGEMPAEPSRYGLAFTVLPTIIFFSAFSALLYHLRVLQWIVYGFAWLMSKTMKLSGAECLAAAANIFIGQTEAPLVVKPYLKTMNRSELMSLMTGGMATIAGGVLVIYMAVLGGGAEPEIVRFGQHLLTASILSAPAAMVAAKLIAPQTEKIDLALAFPQESPSSSVMDALTRGTADGIRLALNVGGMLIAFTAVVALANWVVANGIGGWTGLNGWVSSVTDGRFAAFDFSFIVGILSAPFAWLIGTPVEDVLVMGKLLGERLVLNEFIAYLELAELRSEGAFRDSRTVVIATYALCGFANFTSVGIQVGGITALEESQRENLLRYGYKALFGGMIACYMTAIVASLFVSV